MKSLLPTGSLDSEFTQLGEIESALEIVLKQFQINLADTLNATLYSYTNFRSLVSDGAFMVTETTSLNASTAQLKRVLSTFIVSQALQANNIIVTVAEGVSPYNLTHNLTKHENFSLPFSILPQNAWHVNCQDDYNDVGVCNNWWFDSVLGDAYALYKLDSIGENYYDLMNTLFRNKWTSGEELFLGSMNCLVHRSSEGSAVIGYENASSYHKLGLLDIETLAELSLIHIDATTLQTTCNANLRTCIWNQTNNPVEKNGLEFVAATTPESFSIYGCSYAWPDACNYTFTAGFVQDGLPLPLAGWNSTSLTGVKNCHDNYDDTGWGGAGYHQSDSECDKYPASYLGPGLWLDTNLCGPSSTPTHIFSRCLARISSLTYRCRDFWHKFTCLMTCTLQ